MTIIIAANLGNNKFMMASDSLCANQNGTKIQHDVPKMIKGQSYLIGLAGAYHDFYKVRAALAHLEGEGPLTVDSLVITLQHINNETNDKWESHLVLVTHEGIFSIDSCLGTVKTTNSYYATGSGQEFVLGYFEGKFLENPAFKIKKKDVLTAVEVAKKLNVFCGGTVCTNFLVFKEN